jgi:hypothetical protein
MNKFASLVKYAEMYKSATKWKELLRAGQLSTRSLARIMNAAGAEKKFLSEGVDILTPLRQAMYKYFPEGPQISRFEKDVFAQTAQKKYGPRYAKYITDTGGKAVKQLAETVKANPKGLYVKPGTPGLYEKKPGPISEIHFYRSNDGSPPFSQAQIYRDMKRERAFMATPLANRQVTARDSAGKLLNQISQGLRKNSGPDVFDHGMYPLYRNLVKNRSVFNSFEEGKAMVKLMRMLEKIIKNTDTKLSPQEALALMLHQGYKLAPRRKTHLLSGTSSPFNKDMFRGKSLLEQMELLLKTDADGMPLLMSPNYNPITKTVTSPLGIGSPITRHEIAHGFWDRGSTAYRIGVIKRIDEMLKRHPEVQKAILQKNPIQIFNELIAQTIAGRGGSRSAQRFINQTMQYGRDFVPRKQTITEDFFGHKITEEYSRGLPYLKDILRKANKLDPSGLDSAMITQLVNNYKLSLPRSAAK